MNEHADSLIDISKKYFQFVTKTTASPNSESEEEEKSEEDKEKLRRVIDFICATSKKIEDNPETAQANLDRYSKSVVPASQSYLDEESPPHTSDSEVEEQFMQSLMELFAKANQISHQANAEAAKAQEADNKFKNK